MAEPSIRRRLIGLLLGSVAAGWLAVTALAYFDAHREADRLLDAHLAQVTGILTAGAGHELLELDSGDLGDLGPSDYAQRVSFQVWDERGGLVLASKDAPGRRFSPAAGGFSDSELGGRRWRVFTARDREGEYLVEVAEDHGVREAIARRVALNALVPLAAGLPLVGLLVWFAVGRALRPLALLGDEVSARDPLDPRPVDLAGPAETAPLVERLNELFHRIRRASELERRFTADASHELRKPVAAVRAQAEVARTTSDEVTRNSALDQLITASDRMADLLDQLLTLARLERGDADADQSVVILDEVARIEIAALLSSAAQVEPAIELSAPEVIHVRGNSALLGILVRNLVVNAMRHGAPPVLVHVGTDQGRAVLRVSDAGPGVARADLDRLGERFFRGASPGGPGSGLGLSIARRITALHAGSLSFSPGPGGQGFEARVSLPLVPRGPD
ncbi:MAG: sensor histidine kinase N-terminal domain-containing protein [Gammaproteobacteria bacterium]|nr:sensor histidine kinase N-terminal domain-containing protein [Gammaproteobacteria bacterium]